MSVQDSCTTKSDNLERALKKIHEIARNAAGGDYTYRGEPECFPKISSTLY